MEFIIFALVFICLMALLNWYTWKRFLSKLSHEYSRYLIIIPVVLILGNLFFVFDILTDIIPDSQLLYTITSSFIGMTFMIFVIAVIYDLTINVSKHIPYEPEKRRTLKVIFDVTMLIAAFSYLFRGFSQGLRFPEVNAIQVKIKDLPVEKLNIVQLSDVHVGRTIKRDFIEEIVSTINQLNPDMVVLTGDIFDLPPAQIEYDLYPLRDLTAPTYFILGNHEYFHGPGEAIQFMDSIGIKPLLNEAVTVGKAGREINLIGINDVIGRRTELYPPDVKQAYHNVDQQKPCVVLAHQPRMIEEMEDYRCDLMLSGHTHGGQIFPFGILVMTAQPYLAGLYQHTAEQQIFVSRGTGYWGPPMRFLAPSEISQVILTPA